MLGSIAALAAGAGSAWAQAPTPPVPLGTAPAGVVSAGEPLGTPVGGGVVPASGATPSPVIMPPISVGPPGDPNGIGPAGGFGPPPGPMYPTPGPYAQPRWQPAAPGLGEAVAGAPGGRVPRYWVAGEYLLWFPKSMPATYPLVTTSAPSDQGLLGRPSTLVLAGGEDFSFNGVSGFRMTLGFWGDADRRIGGEVSGFYMGEKSDSDFFQSSPSGIPTLARPFIDSANRRGTASLLIANPNFANGAILVDARTSSYSLEGTAVFNILRSVPGASTYSYSLDFIMGYRFFELQEELLIESQSQLNVPPTVTPQFVIGPFGVLTQVGTAVTPVPVPFGGITITSPSVVSIRDGFRTTNRFNGGQVGLRGEVRYGMFTLSASGKFAIGYMNQMIDIGGGSAFSSPGGRFGSAFGGLYNNAANIGKYNNDEFAIMPEATGNIGVNITRSLTAHVGYNFLYVNRVVRPSQQLNQVVNSATVPFSPNYGQLGRPNVTSNLFQQDDFWLMGINFGLGLKF
jgi:hypothetical protein